jgi:D-lactate dehydrogenase (cytochrome)
VQVNLKRNPVDLSDDFLEELRGVVEQRLSTSGPVCFQHGKDESWHESMPPGAVVFAHSTEEVSQIVKICAQHKIPVIPYGTGTALEGNVSAVNGGVCIDLTEMNQILSVNAEDLDVVVQPGVRRKQLNEYLRDTGLFFPIDPGADASLGGMAATRASGTNAVRYGTMRENVLSMVVVMADGRIIKTSSRSKKSSAGYDLTRLFVGSEGTLGVITEITLRLYGIPESISAAVCAFPDLESAVNTVITTIQCGIPIARIELMDDIQMKALNAYSDFDYPEQSTLMFEFHGTEEGVKEQAEMVGEIASDNNAGIFEWATKAEDRSKLWQGRHDSYYAAMALRPGAKGMATDVCVPISKLAECILETRKDIDEQKLLSPIVGHVGDGNFHCCFVMDPDDPEEMARVDGVNKRMVMRAIAMGGTCTGEHGVGIGKIEYLKAEHGEALSVMRSMKIALDPENIMNPGKIINL